MQHVWRCSPSRRIIPKSVRVLHATHTVSPREQRRLVSERGLCIVWWGVKKCRHYLYGRHLTAQPDQQSLMYRTVSFQGLDNDSLVRWRECLTDIDIMVKYIKDTTNVVANARSCTPVNSLTCTSTAVVLDEFPFLSILRSSYMPDTHAGAISAKLDTNKH